MGELDTSAMDVSTLAVEWIEIYSRIRTVSLSIVSTLAVEWIEIIGVYHRQGSGPRLHPRGGVD